MQHQAPNNRTDFCMPPDRKSRRNSCQRYSTGTADAAKTPRSSIVGGKIGTKDGPITKTKRQGTDSMHCEEHKHLLGGTVPVENEGSRDKKMHGLKTYRSNESRNTHEYENINSSSDEQGDYQFEANSAGDDAVDQGSDRSSVSSTSLSSESANSNVFGSDDDEEDNNEGSGVDFSYDLYQDDDSTCSGKDAEKKRLQGQASLRGVSLPDPSDTQFPKGRYAGDPVPRKAHNLVNSAIAATMKVRGTIGRAMHRGDDEGRPSAKRVKRQPPAEEDADDNASVGQQRKAAHPKSSKKAVQARQKGKDRRYDFDGEDEDDEDDEDDEEDEDEVQDAQDRSIDNVHSDGGDARDQEKGRYSHAWKSQESDTQPNRASGRIKMQQLMLNQSKILQRTGGGDGGGGGGGSSSSSASASSRKGGWNGEGNEGNDKHTRGKSRQTNSSRRPTVRMSKCWLCTFANSKMAKQISSFVSANSGIMDPTIMADQIKQEVLREVSFARLAFIKLVSFQNVHTER
jgi:hypothetical protein